MLLLKPFWIYGCVSFSVVCGSVQITTLPDIWSSRHLTLILTSIAAVFVPLEIWIGSRNFEWETMFLVPESAMSVVLTLGSVCHVTNTLVVIAVFYTICFTPLCLYNTAHLIKVSVIIPRFRSRSLLPAL